MKDYTFQSERLGFRPWLETDLKELHIMNQDEEVMRFFPGIPTRENSRQFIQRQQAQLKAKGYCYFAVDLMSSGEFAGWIGISDQDFEADFTPCVDIGWRLKRSLWKQGLATEGAKASLDLAFQTIGLTQILSMAPEVNLPSIAVMKKIGMQQIGTFDHPKLLNNDYLRKCALYQISKN